MFSVFFGNKPADNVVDIRFNRAPLRIAIHDYGRYDRNRLDVLVANSRLVEINNPHATIL
jgi:hypothetical protein